MLIHKEQMLINNYLQNEKEKTNYQDGNELGRCQSYETRRS